MGQTLLLLLAPLGIPALVVGPCSFIMYMYMYVYVHVHVMYVHVVILFFFARIGRATGYKSSELASLVEGSSLFVGGKEIEVNHLRGSLFFLTF